MRPRPHRLEAPAVERRRVGGVLVDYHGAGGKLPGVGEPLNERGDPLGRHGVGRVEKHDVKGGAGKAAPLKVAKAKGKKSFKVAKWTTKKAKRYLKVAKATGRVTVKKGAPKGTYKFKVKVTAKGNKNYRAKSVVKAVKIRVK